VGQDGGCSGDSEVTPQCRPVQGVGLGADRLSGRFDVVLAAMDHKVDRSRLAMPDATLSLRFPKTSFLTK
jgi:hypothetical protein